jgi:glycosyltransferase involved in cell wall biosynthesis
MNNDIPDDAIVYRKKIRFPEFDSMNVNTKKKKLFHKLCLVIKDLFFSPDKFIWVVLSLLPKMIRTIKKEKIKVVIISGSPFSSFIAGFVLKKLLRIKLILDFRDPWSNMPVNKKHGYLRRKSISFWEKTCVKNADMITGCTDSVLSDLQAMYDPKGKLLKIPNGFDPDDLVSLNKCVSEQKNSFTFLYTGKYMINSDEYSPQNLVNAFIYFLNKYDIKDCLLKLIGLTDEKTRKYINNLKCEQIIMNDLMPKQDVLGEISIADVLLHFYYPETHTDTISLKLYEYAMFSKPIISLNTKNGEMYDFIKTYKLGETVDTNNIEEISEILYKAYCGKVDFCQNPIETLHDYNVENLTSILVKNIKDLGE